METQRFLIREPEFVDYEYFVRWENDPMVTKYLTYDEERSYEEEVTEAIYNKFSKDRMDFTIVERETYRPVGRVFVSRVDTQSDSLDITKFYIGETELWGQGIAREIINELLEYFFTFLHMERVTIDHYVGNKRAHTLYESIGFRQEGTGRHATKKNGQYYDLVFMSILRSEFFGEKD